MTAASSGQSNPNSIQTGNRSPSNPGTTSPSNPNPATAGRKHTIQAGDTPAAIARRYGVKLDALMSANPGLDPRKLRVGQTVNIPAS